MKLENLLHLMPSFSPPAALHIACSQPARPPRPPILCSLLYSWLTVAWRPLVLSDPGHHSGPVHRARRVQPLLIPAWLSAFMISWPWGNTHVYVCGGRRIFHITFMHGCSWVKTRVPTMKAQHVSEARLHSGIPWGFLLMPGCPPRSPSCCWPGVCLGIRYL